MDIPAISIKADTEVEEAARIVLEQYRHRLPVVDEVGHLIGMVTLGDILKALLGQ
jgi:CBS domain-containing protein